MKKRNKAKICFDSIMIILFILMYNISILGLAFHEIGGLILCCACLLHCILNRKWIIQISKKISNPILHKETKFKYYINLILFINFFFILISGLFISEIINPSLAIETFFFKSLHIASSIFGIIMLTIHIILNTQLKEILCSKISTFIKEKKTVFTNLSKKPQENLNALKALKN